jgi:hypothetical protein
VLSVNPLKTIVGQGYTMQINVTVANQGDYMETFNVTLYANTTTIKTREITLTSLNSTTITFAWDTSGFVKGNYTISAYAWSVLGETNKADNTLSDGSVLISCVGDVNGDRTTELTDYQLVKKAMASTLGSPNWNPNADINSDDIIDVTDYQIVKSHIPTTDP